jgi:hypothetical protein
VKKIELMAETAQREVCGAEDKKLAEKVRGIGENKEKG